MALFDDEAYTPGIGLSPAAPAGRPNINRDEDEILSGMGTMGRMGMALQSFGNAVTGRPDPMRSLVKDRREDRLLKLKEVELKTTTFDKSVEQLRKLRGPEREAFAKSRAEYLNEISPGLGQPLLDMAKRPDLLESLGELKEIPAVQAAARIGPEALERLVTSGTFMEKIAQPFLDDKKTPVVMRKVASLRDQFKLTNPDRFKEIEKGGITPAEINEMSKTLSGNPEFAALALTEGDQMFISRHEDRIYAPLGIMTSKTHQAALGEEAKQGAKPEKPLSEVGKLRADLDAGRITQVEYDAKVKKLTTHQPPVNVYSQSLTPGVDAQGNPVFVQGSGRPDTPPRVVPGVFPPEKAGAARERKEAEQGEATVQGVRERISEMTKLIQGNTAIVGPAGFARRIGETAAGVVAPDAPTPAIDYQNHLRLLVADTRKLVEKDPNLSNEERRNLLESLGGGIVQTPGSAIRALNNVMSHVENKAATGPSRGRRVEDAVKGAGWSYEPDQYDYRVVDGKVQRKRKGK